MEMSVRVAVLYRCKDCGEIFEEDEIEVIEGKQRCGDWYEDYSEEHCPYCSSEDFKRYYEDIEEDYTND